jgi:hypothetical protein
LKRGFVLTCQCHPITNVVTLNYYVWKKLRDWEIEKFKVLAELAW